MIKINLSQYEIARLVEFAVRDMNSSHMGSDDFIIPEYQILKDKISNATHFIELNNTEVEILCGWVHDGITRSSIKKVEDDLMAAKIYDAIYAEFSGNKTDYVFRLMKLQDSLNNIAKLAGKDEIESGEVIPKAQPVTALDGTNPVDTADDEPAPVSKEQKENAGCLSEKEKAKNVTELANKMKNLAKKMK